MMFGEPLLSVFLRAFSSEAAVGSRSENAAKQNSESVPIQSERMRLHPGIPRATPKFWERP
jgi:hypothetical protein